MPVVFNEPLSFLQRMTEYMEYARLLRCAAEQDDPVERMKYVAGKCCFKLKLFLLSCFINEKNGFCLNFKICSICCVSISVELGTLGKTV